MEQATRGDGDGQYVSASEKASESSEYVVRILWANTFSEIKHGRRRLPARDLLSHK